MIVVAALELTSGVAHSASYPPRNWQQPSQPPSLKSRQTLKAGSWRLVVETEKFSGDIHCHLNDGAHGVVYTSGALGFGFGRSVHTLGGWVRIDDGAPLRWRDYLPELYRLDAPVNRSGLENATDGKVWIPAAALDHAQHLAIQPSEHRHPVTYSLTGLAQLREAGRSLGCTPDSRFVP